MGLRNLKEDFDVINYLESRGIEYWTEGKNVTQGWVNINCVFCPDHSNHLGIHYTEGNGFHCWLCGESGDIIKLVRKVEECGFDKAVRVLKQFQEVAPVVEEEKRIERPRGNVLPEGFEEIVKGKEPDLVKRYFARRRFDLALCQSHGLGWVRIGRYQHRLIVPITLGGEVMSFQAADLTGMARVPYLSCPDARGRMPIKHLLYGVDWLGGSEQVVLVEGVTDKWRMGNCSLALMGKKWTREQLKLLHDVASDKVIKVLLDLDAVRDGYGLARELSANFQEVVLVELELGDPADPADFDEAMVRRVYDI